jgi:P4 family phage/plasmid primase-like protien
MEFSKYILKFVKDTDKLQTHLSFNKGKYNVPDNKYNEFYKQYYTAMKNNEELYLIEKIHNTNFKFFIDLDNLLSDDDVQLMIEIFNKTITKIVKQQNLESTSNIISKRDNKYHINYFNLIVNCHIAKLICDNVKQELITLNKSNLSSCIDYSVYRTGLRLLGSKKNKKENISYRIYNISTQIYTELKDTSFEDFMKTVIRVTQEFSLCELHNDYVQSKQKSINHHNIPIKGIENNKISDEIVNLLQDLKLQNSCIKDLIIDVDRVYKTQSKTGIFCYYISIKDKNCPFKGREHQRQSYPLYIELSINGVFIKCYDQECLRKKFPDEGIKLPTNFQTKYSELFLSMTTKYWKSDVELTEDIKQCLEDSLTGSHYQIAKAIFSIYKDRFRVDDVTKTSWFEFDGIRWNPSHLINILISEELPKYYRGIKISDTSVKNDNLQDFLTNSDKIDSNLRNEMVDNIIRKLENVSFKNHVLNQITYLFKIHDSEFYNNLDSQPHLLGFKNGIYDFNQNSFRKSIQSDYIRFSTGYDYIEYDEDNQHIQDIYEFLAKIVPNQTVREYMLKVLGKSLIGIPDEKFYIWTGLSGANGKSTLVNFLEYTLGDYTTSVDISLLTNKRGNSSNASPDIVRLRGKRIFTFQEPEHDDQLKTGILKQFTGGDTIIARELFKAPVTFKLQGTMILCCNDLPSISSIDGGTWRRIRVIEFKSKFCEHPVKPNEFKIDPSIKQKIKNWRPYFMSILIHWYNRFLYEGLQEPDEVKSATAKYKVDNDKFNEFFDQCVSESNTFESNKNIYNSFQHWWISAYPSSKLPDIKALRRAMKIKFGDEQEKSINGARQYGFNIILKHESYLESDNEI